MGLDKNLKYWSRVNHILDAISCVTSSDFSPHYISLSMSSLLFEIKLYKLLLNLVF